MNLKQLIRIVSRTFKFIVVPALIPAFAYSQAERILTLDQCLEQARLNYPKTGQKELIRKGMYNSLSNVAKGYLPQVQVNGSATYQSDVTQFPVRLPNVDVPVISKDQYKIYTELTQQIYDGGYSTIQKEMAVQNAQVEYSKLEVELYQLRESVQQLYFGILLTDQLILQSEIMKNDLKANVSRVEAGVKNGIMLPGNLEILQAEMIRADQKILELQYSRKAYCDMLALFIHEDQNVDFKLQKPELKVLPAELNRPEFTLFDNQAGILNIQDRASRNKALPRFSFFVQGGFGRPALNMLNNDMKAYSIGGIRMNWPINGFYTRNTDKISISVQREQIRIQKDNFIFQQNLQIAQQKREIEKFNLLLEGDKKIIELRESIRRSASRQLELGVITSNDYLLELNAEDKARQNLAQHEIQALQSRYKLNFITGNN